MKRLLIVGFLSFLALPSFSQHIDPVEGSNIIFGLYAGAGCATYSNYNVAPSAGFGLSKGFFFRGSWGFDLFYQTYSLYYDNEQNSAKHGTGNAGVILRHASSYVFIAPKFEYGLGYKQNVHVYTSVGIGFKIAGFDSLRKWDHSYGSTTGVGYYDSSLDLSKNINGMLFRIGMGFKEFMGLGRHWRLTVTEDFGFLPGGLTKTGDLNTPSRTQYYPQKLNPAYISLQIGICHTRLP